MGYCILFWVSMGLNGLLVVRRVLGANTQISIPIFNVFLVAKQNAWTLKWIFRSSQIVRFCFPNLSLKANVICVWHKMALYLFTTTLFKFFIASAGARIVSSNLWTVIFYGAILRTTTTSATAARLFSFT